MKMDEMVQLIDGNFSFYPVAFCKAHRAFLTNGLCDTHKCVKRGCISLEMLDQSNEEKDDGE